VGGTLNEASRASDFWKEARTNMSLDIKKLERVSEKPDGKITARCPACAVAGGDKKGEHLVVFADGKFGCVKFPGDSEHRNQVYSLAGEGKKRTHLAVKLAVKPSTIPKVSAVMNLAAFPRFSGKVKRAWLHKQSDPPNSDKPEAEENPQLEFAFMKDLPKGNTPTAELPKSEKKYEHPDWVNRLFMSVPPRRVIPPPPPLPPNPMADRL
jgi:hypothetical protein